MMKFFLKSLSLTILAFSLVFFANARDNLKRIGQIVVTSIDTTNVTTQFLEPDDIGRAVFGEQLESLGNSWFVNNVFIPGNQHPVQPHFAVELSDSLIVSRLQKLEEAVKLSYNSVVRDYIEMYLFRKANQMEIMLGLTAYYFPLFEEIFDRYDLPLEMKYMAIVESALNPRAVSRAGAVGLWQFMHGTAKLLKMEVSTYVDERRDVLKSTEAAAKYISELYDIFHDWHLVIAAYNCGPGNVSKAIARSGGKTDYWQIYYLLPRETRGHVPAYIAATYALNYYKEYGLEPRMPSISLQTDTVMIGHTISLKQISNNLGLDLEALRELNPVYRRDVVPGKPDRHYPIRIPTEYVPQFIANLDTIYNQDRAAHFPGQTLVTPQTRASGEDIAFDIQGKTKIYYTVKQGDNPGYIANWFNVPLGELKAWNSISRNLIRVGQKLAIYVPDDRTEHYKKINNLSFSAKQELVGKAAPTNPVEAKPETPEEKMMAMADNSSAEYECYTVKRGDNFWSIAKKYPGISNYDIMRLNGITDSHSLKTGQVLKIRPKT